MMALEVHLCTRAKEDKWTSDVVLLLLIHSFNGAPTISTHVVPVSCHETPSTQKNHPIAPASKMGKPSMSKGSVRECK